MVPPLDELCKAQEEEVDEEVEEEDEEGSYHAHLDRLIQNLLKEAKDKSKGWVSRSFSDHTELAFRKVGASERQEGKKYLMKESSLSVVNLRFHDVELL